MDTTQLITNIEDYMVQILKLDSGEVRLYYHLLRQSRIVNKGDVLISYSKLAEALNSSRNAIQPRIRTLQKKGVVQVVATGWAGTRVQVFLPREIPGAVPQRSSEYRIDLEQLDFYKDAKYRPAIFSREQGKCFYCHRLLTDEDAGLDHAEPQVSNGRNNYKNVVAACHSCNSSKGGEPASDFLRKLETARKLDLAFPP